MAKAAFRQRDVARLIKGAVDGGFALGTFSVQLIDGRPTLIPLIAPGARPSTAKHPTGDETLDTELAAWRAQHGED